VSNQCGRRGAASGTETHEPARRLRPCAEEAPWQEKDFER
jgi:hypothetical protein